MKIRQGFVSNSSSSSFLIIGRQVQFSDIKDGDLVYIKGKEFNDGEDVFKLTPEIKKILDNKIIPSIFTFYKASIGFDFRQDGATLPTVDVKEGDRVIWLDKDNDSITNVGEFEFYYDDCLEDKNSHSSLYDLDGEYITIIGRKVCELSEDEKFEELWCHAEIYDTAYMIKINNKKEYLKCNELKGEKEFFHVRDFCADNTALKLGKIEDRYLYSIYVEKKVNSINEVKRIKKGKKHENKEELCF